MVDRVRWSVAKLDRLLALGKLDRYDKATVRAIREALALALREHKAAQPLDILKAVGA